MDKYAVQPAKVMARHADAVWELKESAKWSLDLEERKRAIKQLAGYGPEAIQSIVEIKEVSAYEAIREACIEAIRAAASQKTISKSRKSTRKKSSKRRKMKRKS
jgi:hypothetical protein